MKDSSQADISIERDHLITLVMYKKNHWALLGTEVRVQVQQTRTAEAPLLSNYWRSDKTPLECETT